MTQLLNQLLLSISLITTGSALKCYMCNPNETFISEGKPSCIPKPVTCENETHCLSIRTKLSENSERTFKSCAQADKCVSARTVCDMFKTKSNNTVCEDHCCDKDLCNLNVHTNKGVCSIVSLTALVTSILSMLPHVLGMN